MLSRYSFGAYDSTVWTVQTYLSQLGYSVGTVDGLWGPNTQGAAFDFRQIQGLSPANGIEQGDVLDTAFMVALSGAVAAAGLEVVTPPEGGPGGGSGVGPVVASGGRAPPPAPPAPKSDTASIVLPLAILGVGAFLIFGGKR